MKHLLLIIILTLGMVSCSNVKTVDELRLIKVGSTQIEVLYLLGDPHEIKLEVGSEEWRYSYETGNRYYNSFIITIVGEKVTKFTSY